MFIQMKKFVLQEAQKTISLAQTHLLSHQKSLLNVLLSLTQDENQFEVEEILNIIAELLRTEEEMFQTEK